MAYAYNLISATVDITTAQNIYSAIIDMGDQHLVSGCIYTTNIHTDASIITIRVYQNGMLLNGQGTQRFKPAGVTNAHYQLGPYLILSGATLAISMESDNANDTAVTFAGAIFKTQQSNPMYLGASAQSLADLKDFADAGYDPDTNKVQGVVLTDTTTTVTNEVTTDAASKTGLSLAATGLDAITATAPGGVASTFPQMVVQIWRRFFHKTTLSSGSLITYADDGTTPETTQTASDDGTTQTLGDAS